MSLTPLFTAVGEALRKEQQALNQADAINGNHGDHMVEIFEIAAQAAQDNGSADLADAMQQGGDLLRQQAHNGSALLYARGLEQMAEQFRRYGIALSDLIGYVQKTVFEDHRQEADPGAAEAKSGDVLKALMGGLAGWSRLESGQAPKDNPLDVGILFEFGMAYLQAKQRGGTRSEVLADAAASVSPLNSVPYRYQSGKLAIQAFLQAMEHA